MNHDSDFYTDEPLDFLSGNDSDGKEDSLWDYVDVPDNRRGMSWLDDYKLNNADEAPLDIRLLLEMIRKDYWSITNNKAFYEQAVFMAGYTDDAPIVPFSTYFPTYRQMTVSQLRSYFTIRKLLRLGSHPDVPLSYLFIYCYETLMQIGVSTPEEGYELLCDLRDNYPAMNPRKQPYLTEWIRDYVVWYGLANHFNECFAGELQMDRQEEMLDHYENACDNELFGVLDTLAGHCITKGALFKKQPEATAEAVAAVFRQLAPKLEKYYGKLFGTLCFGDHSMRSHVMFSSAVFYSPTPIKEDSVKVAPYHQYVCHSGLWRRTVNSGYSILTPAILRSVLRTIDAWLRKALNVKPFIKTAHAVAVPAIFRTVPDVLGEWLKEWKAKEGERLKEARREAIRKARESVSIDMSQLGNIRRDADVVRDALIVEESAQDILAGEAPLEMSVPEKETPAKDETGAETGSEETEFINILLANGDYGAFLRQKHIPAGVMVENINNKAMETIGDIVIEDDGGKITIIEDYIDDITHLYD